MGLTIEATPPINEMMLGFYLQTFVTYCMSLMNLLFFLHKFSKCFFGVNRKHHGGKLCLGGNLEAVGLLWTLMMITLTNEVLCLGLKLH